jgi:hypothetical protein
MFSPVGEIADPTGSADPAGAYDNPGSGDGATPDRAARSIVADTGSPAAEAMSSLQVLTDAPPGELVAHRGLVSVPALTTVAIGISVAFTIVFGIIPEPILDFAHQATLLFT